MASRGFATALFEGNRYARVEPTIGCFLSHAALWARCIDGDEPMVVCEHDAVFVAPLPDLSAVTHLCNLGAPSYGKWTTPEPGIGPFASKAGGYLGGTHGYYVTPAGAADLLDKARTEAQTPDQFITRARFPWLQECYPWPIVCNDSFTTIQREEGCKAKHHRVEVI
jgi:GR25 family glycosyltransferase involved in LPS biosynthesis